MFLVQVIILGENFDSSIFNESLNLFNEIMLKNFCRERRNFFVEDFPHFSNLTIQFLERLILKSDEEISYCKW